MSDELKPCPFCGGRAVFVTLSHGRYPHVVRCEKCEATSKGSAYVNDEYNAETWNNRAKDARISELESLLREAQTELNVHGSCDITPNFDLLSRIDAALVDKKT